MQQIGAAPIIGQPRGDIGKNPSRPFNSKHPNHLQARVEDFRVKILRTMKIRRSEVVEPCRNVPVLSVAQVLRGDGGELGVLKQVVRQAIQSGSPAADGCSKEATTGLENARRLVQRLGTIWRGGQVIERTQQQNHIRGFTGKSQVPRVANPARGKRPGSGAAAAFGLGYETRNRVDQMNRISGLSQPERIGSGSAADVQDGGRRGGCVALDQLPCAQCLKQEWAFFEPAFLGRPAVVLGNGQIEFKRLLIHAAHLLHDQTIHIDALIEFAGGILSALDTLIGYWVAVKNKE